MALTKRQKLFVQAVVSDPTKPLIDCVKEAGYSKNRLGVTASNLKKHSEVQAAIAEILNKKLETAPTKEGTYKTINTVKEMCLRNGDSSWAASTLLKAAEMEAKLLGMFAEQPPLPVTEDNRSIVVQFVSPDMSAEEIRQLNASARHMESKLALTEGTLGRLPAEGQQATGPELLPPSVPVPTGDIMRLEISEEERKRLERVSMPLGGALTSRRCPRHGTFESRWAQHSDLSWGWSDCPRCQPAMAVQ